MRNWAKAPTAENTKNLPMQGSTLWHRYLYVPRKTKSCKDDHAGLHLPGPALTFTPPNPKTHKASLSFFGLPFLLWPPFPPLASVSSFGLPQPLSSALPFFPPLHMLVLSIRFPMSISASYPFPIPPPLTQSHPPHLLLGPSPVTPLLNTPFPPLRTLFRTLYPTGAQREHKHPSKKPLPFHHFHRISPPFPFKRLPKRTLSNTVLTQNNSLSN